MEFLKGLDTFGYPITFTHNKHLKFKSMAGVTVSVVSKLGLLCYFLFLLTYVFRR